MAYIQGIDKNQIILYTQAIDDYIEEDNPVQFIDAFVDNLDLMALSLNIQIQRILAVPLIILLIC